MNRKPRPLWPIVTAALIGLPVLYVASFGPACWLVSLSTTKRTVSKVYAPLGTVISRGPVLISDVLYWYASIGLRAHVGVPVFFERDTARLISPRE